MCLFEIGVKRDGRKAVKEGQRLCDSSVPFSGGGYCFFKITWSLLCSALLFLQFSWLLLPCLSNFPFPFSPYTMSFSMIIAAHLLVNFLGGVNSDSWYLFLDRRKRSKWIDSRLEAFILSKVTTTIPG